MYKLITSGQDPVRLKESVDDILGQTKLLSMATSSKDAEPWINTVCFAYDDALTIYIVTYPDSKHMKNLESNNQIALNIFNSQQDGKNKQGLQLAGMFSPVSESGQEQALRTWGKRILGDNKVDKFIEDFKTWSVKPYKIVIDYVKIFDEVRFGKETWVTCSVER
jgi:uncharacterized protein YhbP (UPF0306 family)